MRKCISIFAVLLLAGVGHGGVAKDVMAIKISVAGGINTKNAKVLTAYAAWTTETYTDIVKVYKERDAKTATATQEQKKILASLSNLINVKWENTTDYENGLKSYNALAITRVGQASAALLADDLPTAIAKHKETIVLQMSFARVFGLGDAESVRVATYLEEMKTLLKEIPYPKNVGDM